MGWVSNAASWVAKSKAGKFAVKGAKWGAAGALVGSAVVAAPIVVSELRNSRRADDDAPLPPPAELTAPLPQVFEAPPLPQPETLMNEPLVQNGPMATREKMRRAGASLGVEGAPNILGADGRNAIDGSKGVQELNAPSGGRSF